MNEEAKIVRARKDRVARHLYKAHHELTEILWIHPNEAPVYLDFDQAAGLRKLRGIIDELLERHDKAEEQLRAEDNARRVA